MMTVVPLTHCGGEDTLHPNGIIFFFSRAMQSNPNKRRLSMVKPTWFIHVLFGALMVLWTRLTSAGSTLKLAWIFINSCFVLNHRSHDHSGGFDINYPFIQETIKRSPLISFSYSGCVSSVPADSDKATVSQSVSVWGLGEASTGVRRQCDSIG